MPDLALYQLVQTRKVIKYPPMYLVTDVMPRDNHWTLVITESRNRERDGK